MSRRPPTAAALAVVALVAGGCTAAPSSSVGDFQGVQRDVATTVKDLQSDAARSHEDRICSDLLASDLVTRLERAPGGCPAAVHGALKNTDTTDLKVQAVQVSATTATARVKTETGDRDQVDTLRLVKERGRWRISSFG